MIDISKSDAIPVAIAAVRDILNTLSVIDYFDIISSSTGSFSNSTGGLLLEYDCYNRVSTGLTAATTSNKNIVNITYLPNVVAMDTNQSLLVTMAFDAITNGQINNKTANCQITVIIITDRQIIHDTAEVVANSNRNLQSMYQINPAKMFIISLTDNPTSYYDDIAVKLTCDHSGIWNKVVCV